MSAALTPDQSTEVEFISGVTAAGTVSSTSFDTWNNDDPATYSTTTSYEAKWGQPTAGTAATISYAFAATSAWSASEQAAFVATMHLWSAETGATFVQAAGSPNFTITRGSDGSAEGGVTRYYPGTENTAQLGRAVAAVLTIDTSVPGFGPIGTSLSNYGGYPWTVMLHEEGHVLGLGHSGAYNDGGATTTTPQLTSYDSRAWSLMSYIDSDDPAVEAAASTPAGGFHWGLSQGSNGSFYYDTPTTPMPLDILAAQRLYGLPSSTPLSGGQTFGFNCNVAGDIEPFFDFTINTRPVVTLWDEGSGNKLDLSGFSTASGVNLNPGGFTSCAGLTNNVAIAYGVAIDQAVTGSGNDLILANPDGDTILGGSGDDTVLGGGNPVGTMEMLFGNKGDDQLRSSSPGSVELFGGQDSDTITLTSSGQGVVHYLFGNLGDDTVSATGGYNSLYGGQGDDVVTVAADGAGHNYLTGDLGNDTLTSSVGGFDTLHGGRGADTIVLTSHPAGAGDTVMIGVGESTAYSPTDESDVQHISGFISGGDHIVLAGHSTLSVGAGGDLTAYAYGAYASEAAAFEAAYTFAYGDGGANAAHVGATEYLALQESYGGTTTTYLFTADHHVVALVGVGIAGLQSGDVLAG